MLTVANRGDSHRLRLWDTETHAERFAEAELLLGEPGAFGFSPDGSELLLGGPDGTIRLVGVQAGVRAEPSVRLSSAGIEGGVTSVSFSPDGKHLLSGGNDGTIRLWHLAERREVARFDGNSTPVAAVTFQQDGERIVVGYADGTVRNVDSHADPTVVWRRFDHGTGRSTLSPGGAYAALVTEDSELLLYRK